MYSVLQFAETTIYNALAMAQEGILTFYYLWINCVSDTMQETRYRKDPGYYLRQKTATI